MECEEKFEGKSNRERENRVQLFNSMIVIKLRKKKKKSKKKSACEQQLKNA